MDIKKILSLDEMPLKEELEIELKKKYENIVNNNGFLYAEGDIPVLLVAHLDTVHKYLAEPLCFSDDGRFIMSPNGIGGDDRCGVYMILNLIKSLKCHVLFCEQEEVGCIGAKSFCKSNIKPDVNYIIEFDRRGHDDSVFYDCDNKEFEDFVNTVGFKTAYGSCSDISYIAPHLGVSAVNLSSGYYNAHQLYEYIDMEVVERNTSRAKTLIEKEHNKKYAYIEKHKCYDWSKNNKNYNTTTNSTNTNGTVTGARSIKKLLMKLDSKTYWIYREGFSEISDFNYYIDYEGNIYIEHKEKICKKVTGMCVYKKSNLQAPEYNARSQYTTIMSIEV